MENRIEYDAFSTWYSDKAKAENIASECNKTSDGWIYKVVCHNDWYAIAVFDEENFFLGEL